jgi:hypothetical protein
MNVYHIVTERLSNLLNTVSYGSQGSNVLTCANRLDPEGKSMATTETAKVISDVTTEAKKESPKVPFQQLFDQLTTWSQRADSHRDWQCTNPLYESLSSRIRTEQNPLQGSQGSALLHRFYGAGGFSQRNNRAINVLRTGPVPS